MVKRTRSFVGFGLVAVISVAEFNLVSEETQRYATKRVCNFWCDSTR